MCDFIILVAPTADQQALSAAMARHGRAARPIANASLFRALLPGEFPYLTTQSACDCGTVLGTVGNDPETELAKDAARLAKKGWSQARIARAIAQRQAADARPSEPGPDSFALWAGVVGDLFETLKLPHVGLLVHSCAGSIATESFAIARRAAKDAPLTSLETLRPDELLVFRNA